MVSSDHIRQAEFVTIPAKEYARLCEDQRKLDALEAAGVDNWDGYDWAMEALGVE